LFHADRRTDTYDEANSRFLRTPLKTDFQKKNVCKQIHFTIRKIYCSFSEATCSWRKRILSRLLKSEQLHQEFKTHPNIQYGKKCEKDEPKSEVK
jgi:hypothetical protein